MGTALSAALGIGFFACGGSEDGTGGSDGGGNGDGNVSTDDGGIVIKNDAGDAADGGVIRKNAGTCTKPTPVIIGGKDTGFVRCEEGYQHRVTATDCPSLAPREGGVCGGGGGIDCSEDSDCTAKANGICRPNNGGAFICQCAYGCVRDSDCTTGQICECGDPVGLCVTAKCADDKGCTAPALCTSVPSDFGGCGGGGNAYVCQTSADKCDVASDCPDGGSGFGQRICGYDPDAGARACGEGPQACPGRPFLVDHAPRVARLASRIDWHANGLAPVAGELPADVRAALADHWARAGQMEHASVAAFARFSLELLALGAPAWAIEETTAAMADETAHARITFTLASAYAGRDLGPAALSIDGALGAVTDRSVFATLVREGCIGETVAAISATDALEGATDAAVRDALARISEDETRHASFAWRAAGWLVDRGDDAFRAWAKDEMASAIAERLASLDVGTLDEALSADDRDRARAHGLGDAKTEAALVRAALRDIIAPCADALIGAGASTFVPTTAARSLRDVASA